MSYVLRQVAFRARAVCQFAVGLVRGAPIFLPQIKLQDILKIANIVCVFENLLALRVYLARCLQSYTARLGRFQTSIHQELPSS